MNKQIIKCVVACINSNGEPDFFFVKISGTEDQINDGYHYDMAKKYCNSEGYESHLAYDENDCGFTTCFENSFVWESASIVEIDEEELM